MSTFIELIYCESEDDYNGIQSEITKEFPQARFKDASDFIHEFRFELDVDTDNHTFYKFAILRGFALCCLGLTLMVMTKPDEVKRILSEINQEKSKAKV